jgi:hypothetical protein
MTFYRSALPTSFAFLLLLPAAATEGRAQDVLAFLRDRIGLSSGELEQLQGGVAVAKIPKSEDNREVAVFSVVRIQVPMGFFLERVAGVERLMSRDETTLQVGRFDGSPSPEDMAGLELPKGDIEALKKCRVEKCDVKLPAGSIEALHQQVDWSQSDHAQQANDFMARDLAAYLEEYMSVGHAALATYDDKSEPLSVAEGFELLLGQTPYLIEYSAPFHAHLRSYPEANKSGVEDIFYWAVEDFGLKATLTLNHVAIDHQPSTSQSEALIGRKQIYASHYFQAALDILNAVSVSEDDPSQGIYLMSSLRQRYDGKVAGIKRGQLEKGLKKKSAEVAAAIKSELEAAYRWRQGG